MACLIGNWPSTKRLQYHPSAFSRSPRRRWVRTLFDRVEFLQNRCRPSSTTLTRRFLKMTSGIVSKMRSKSPNAVTFVLDSRCLIHRTEDFRDAAPLVERREVELEAGKAAPTGAPRERTGTRPDRVLKELLRQPEERQQFRQQALAALRRKQIDDARLAGNRLTENEVARLHRAGPLIRGGCSTRKSTYTGERGKAIGVKQGLPMWCRSEQPCVWTGSQIN